MVVYDVHDPDVAKVFPPGEVEIRAVRGPIIPGRPLRSAGLSFPRPPKLVAKAG